MKRSRSTWQVVRRRTVLATVGTMSLVVTLAALPVSPANEAATRWADALSEASARDLSSPDAMLGLPPEYRRALYNRLVSPTAKAEFWRALFAEYKRTHTLAPDQAGVLGRAESLLVASTFEGRASDELRKKVIEVAKAVEASLGRDATNALFYGSGPVVRRSSLSWQERVMYSWRKPGPMRTAASWAVPSLLASMTCNCAVGAGDNGSNCGYEMHCGFHEDTCPMSQWTTWGCGPWWMSPCDGTCSYSSPPLPN